MSGTIRIERAGALGYLIVDHAARRNALNAHMWRQIPALAAELDADRSVHVIILRGAGDEAFVSGADISEFSQLRTGSAAAQYDAENVRAFEALHALQKPLIALIHGFCIGGGVALASCADLRYAADDAVFAVPASRLGLGYPLSAAQHLLRLLGQAHAKELFFTARRFTAPQALRLGLVHEVIPKAQLEAHVQKVAEEIAQNAPLAVQGMKRILRLLEASHERGLTEPERLEISDLRTRAFRSADLAEGRAAFHERRPPRFRGE